MGKKKYAKEKRWHERVFSLLWLIGSMQDLEAGRHYCWPKIFCEYNLLNQDKYAFDPCLHKITLFSVISHKYIISKNQNGDAKSDLSQSAQNLRSLFSRPIKSLLMHSFHSFKQLNSLVPTHRQYTKGKAVSKSGSSCDSMRLNNVTQ